MLEDRDLLQAVARLRPEWPALFGEEEAEALAGLLDGLSLDDPDAVGQTADGVWQLLADRPAASARLGAELGIKGPLLDVRGNPYHELPGRRDEPIPATTMMVCPVDPSHYRRRLMFKGQKLRCSEHDGVWLVPEDQVKPKE